MAATGAVGQVEVKVTAVKVTPTGVAEVEGGAGVPAKDVKVMNEKSICSFWLFRVCEGE